MPLEFAPYYETRFRATPRIRVTLIPVRDETGECRAGLPEMHESTRRLPPPPRAKRIETSRTVHGRTLTDAYAWLADRADPDVTRYLEDENAFTEAVLGETDPLRETLYAEMRGRIQETDLTVPYPQDGWLYYTRTEDDLQYPIHCRRPIGSLESEEQVLLDLNAMAEGLDYLELGDFEVSDDGSILAFSTDTTGYRQYTLQFKDLRTGEMYPERIEKTHTVAWASDSRTVFYTTEDPSKRPYRLWRHVVGATGDDALVYEEADRLYWFGVYRSRSREYVFAASESKTTSEVRAIPAAAPDAEPRVILARREDHEYDVDHHPRGFVFRSNLDAKNFRIAIAPVDDPRPESWTELVAHRDDVMLDDFLLFQDHCVVRELDDGLPRMRVLDLENGASRTIAFDEPAYSVAFGANEEFRSRALRIRYQSLVTPDSVEDVDLLTGARTLLKRQPVLGGFDPADYMSERIHATADDGARIPISILRRKDRPAGERAPLLLYGYGSYGHAVPITFGSNRLSLVDRGVTWAIAHVRGGGELGTKWHDEGKLGKKRNTFTDFIRASDALVENGYTTHDRMAIMGASAGGLLVGAVVNMRPDLCRSAIAVVPFVDVLNTMLDPELPLTIGEYLEWGNPNEKQAFDDIASYCPYTNLQAREYPRMLLRASLNDSQVGYWEAAKYVAKLRHLGKRDASLLLRVNLEAGHAGASGRFDYLREIAVDWAFVLDTLNVDSTPRESHDE